ncbi:MAG: hypothetical protein AAF514_21875, partial [Verrucomicrobiota bacterium]
VGCQQITPGMVGLARKLKGKPFHLIASYCQHGTKEQAVAALKKEGWDENMANLTVMNQTRFPKAPVKYVPYYLVFDHTGKLQQNHMAGPYHGGDGDHYQKVVKELLRKIPAGNELTAAPRKTGAHAPMRKWKNAQGKTITARLLEVTKSNVRLQVAEGRIYTYALDKLSEESRKKILPLAQEKDE